MKECEKDQLAQLEFLKARARKLLNRYLLSPFARRDMAANLEKSFELMEECHNSMEEYLNIPYEDCSCSDIADIIRQTILWDNCIFQLNHNINSAIDFSLVVIEKNTNNSKPTFSREDLENVEKEFYETREALSMIYAIYRNIAAREFKMYTSWF
jgi:hypothetical protein